MLVLRSAWRAQGRGFDLDQVPLAGAGGAGGGLTQAGQIDAARELRFGDELDHEATVREEP